MCSNCTYSKLPERNRLPVCPAKTISIFIAASFNWTLAFFVTEFYGPVSGKVGPAATFWAFATILVLVMAFTIFFTPETKGRSLDEIQQLFKRRGPEDEDPILASTDPVEASIEAEVEAEIQVVRA